jgi:branched-chain amino acid transport system ATP-binding protein
VLDEATEGLAPLIVDRDYRRVLAHADQALVLQNGQVVLQGAADEVATSPALATYLGV